MADRLQAAPGLLPTIDSRSKVRTLPEAWSAARPLLKPAAAAWLSYVALATLLLSPAFRIFDAGLLPYSALVATFVEWTTPAVAEDGSQGPATFVAVLLYVVTAAGALWSWCWAMRIAREVDLRSPLPLIGLTALIAAPLLIAPGVMSDDLYLYNMYGRTISEYGANPFLTAPSAFPDDPHLAWVHWKDLPSAYGPLWLMLSALLSALGADSLTAMVLLYRVAALALHLMTVGVLWRLLQDRPQSAVLPAAIFYAWNPLVLVEVVANAHNDVLVALFAVALVGAAMHRRWRRAAIYASAAVMVKPFAVVLVPAVGRHLWRHLHAAADYRQLAIAVAVGAATTLTFNLPLWSGDALIQNALNNPAASSYANTLWELATRHPWFSANVEDEARYPFLDAVRALAFLGGAVWVLTRRASKFDVPRVAMRLWLVFCLTACWLWPWYFVPVLALAPLAGAAYLPSAAALTAGGLLFWAVWPPRPLDPLPLLYEWRSLVLFGPFLLVWLYAPARVLTSLALGTAAPVTSARGPRSNAPEQSRSVAALAAAIGQPGTSARRLHAPSRSSTTGPASEVQT